MRKLHWGPLCMRYALCCFACCWSTAASAQDAFEPGDLLDAPPPPPPIRHRVPDAPQPQPATSVPDAPQSVPDAPHTPPAPTTAPAEATIPALVKSKTGALPPNSAIWVEAHYALGSGGPIGVWGLAVDLQPVSFFALNLGVGKSYYGTQLSIMPRARLNLGKAFALGFGAGYSTGPYKWDNHDCDWTYDYARCAALGSVVMRWNRADWANFELSLEDRQSPIGARVYIGYATLLTPTASSCESGYHEPCNASQVQAHQQIGGTVYFGGAIALGGGL